MLINILISILLSLGSSSFVLQEGDLLFQDSDCGPFCEAIETVTEGFEGSNLSHIGMVITAEDDDLAVIEAIGEGVVITSIDKFLSRSFDANGDSKVLVGRIDQAHSDLIPKAVQYAKTLLGKSYDDVFDIKNDKYYCSELIYESFKYANGGKEVFQLFPMTFIDPSTESTFEIWVDYYNELKADIPEGAPGLNPGGISLSEHVEIIHAFGIPSGMQY